MASSAETGARDKEYGGRMSGGGRGRGLGLFMPDCVVYDDILNSENTDTLVVYIYTYYKTNPISWCVLTKINADNPKWLRLSAHFLL